MIPRTSRVHAMGCLLALAASLLLGACGGDTTVALPIGGGPAGVEYIIGNTAAPGTLGFGANSLGGQPFAVATQTNLLRTGIHTFGPTGNFKMGVYTDSAGLPNTLVIGSASTPLVDGPQEVSVSPTVLLPGTYWLMFVMDSVNNVGNSGSSTAYRYASHTFSNPLPGSFIGTINGPPHDLTIWMVVQD